MELKAILDNQYETQHFGFHPRFFIDSVYNILFENLLSSLNQLKQFMIQEFGTVMPPHVIQSQIDDILQELMKHCDKCIDKLEVYLNSEVFLIPNHVTLPEDEIHVKSPCTKEDEEKLDREIEEIKKKILQEKAKKYCLKQKIAEQKEVKQHLLCLQNEIVTLLNIASQNGVNKENIEAFFKNISELADMNVGQQMDDFPNKG